MATFFLIRSDTGYFYPNEFRNRWAHGCIYSKHIKYAGKLKIQIEYILKKFKPKHLELLEILDERCIEWPYTPYRDDNHLPKDCIKSYDVSSMASLTYLELKGIL